MKKAIMAAALAFLGVAGPGAANAVTYATTIASFNPGAGERGPNGAGVDAELKALGAPDGNFVSLGAAGSIVLTFGTLFSGSGFVVEVTNGCAVSGGICSQWPELVEVFTSPNGTDFITYNIFVGNGGSSVPGFVNSRATSFTLAGGSFSHLMLVDRSDMIVADANRFESNSGFDVDAVAVSAVSAIPLPAAAWLLLGGLGAVGLVGRKRKAS